MTHAIGDLTSSEVADQDLRNAVAVIPLGSIEQHGPHLPNGTDTIAAELVAEALAEKLDALLVPFGPYGVTPIHSGHPGTINLRRSTFEALLTDICTELIVIGVTRIVFVNWHEGNIASIDAVAMEIQAAHKGVYAITSHACYVAQRVYASQGGELTHGGGIEAMAGHGPRSEPRAHRPGRRVGSAQPRRRHGRDAAQFRDPRIHHRCRRDRRRRLVRRPDLGH